MDGYTAMITVTCEECGESYKPTFSFGKTATPKCPHCGHDAGFQLFVGWVDVESLDTPVPVG